MTKERQSHPFDKKKFDDFINLGSSVPDPQEVDETKAGPSEPFIEPLDNLGENSLDLLLYNNKLDPITGMISR
jgi:hypothetical protein